jgi:RimJ/RimL family protein N-acetyltransferase
MLLTGKTVQLRPAAIADQRSIFEWLAQSDITKFMLGAPDFNDHQPPTWKEFQADYVEEFFSDTNPEKGHSFIILVNNEAVGHINYNDIDRTTNTTELDIWLASQKYTRRGYGQDAILTLCRYLQLSLNCQRFILAPSARNVNAIRAYVKCGFIETNEIPGNFIPDYKDTVVMMKKIAAKQ